MTIQTEQIILTTDSDGRAKQLFQLEDPAELMGVVILTEEPVEILISSFPFLRLDDMTGLKIYENQNFTRNIEYLNLANIHFKSSENDSFAANQNYILDGHIEIQTSGKAEVTTSFKFYFKS